MACFFCLRFFGLWSHVVTRIPKSHNTSYIFDIKNALPAEAERVKKQRKNIICSPRCFITADACMLRRPARRRLRRKARWRRLRWPACRRRAESWLMSGAGRCRVSVPREKPDESATRSNGGFRRSIFRQILLNVGCQTGHFRRGFARKVSQTAPITNLGCKRDLQRPVFRPIPSWASTGGASVEPRCGWTGARRATGDRLRIMKRLGGQERGHASQDAL